MATHETTIHPFSAQGRVAQNTPFLDRVLSIVDRPNLTTCYWVDKFCDCRELGTIHCLETEEDLCSRHYLLRLAEAAPEFASGQKKPVVSVGLDGQAVRFGD